MADKTVVVRIALKAGQFQSGLGQAASAVRGFGVDVSRETDRAASSAAALGLTSAAMGKLVLLGIGGAMAVSAKAAIDFESSLAGVAKTTDLAGNAFDKTNTPLAVFGQAMRNLSQRVPVNVNDLNKIAELGGQLGIEVPNLVSFTDTIARLAVSTNLTIEEAATGLARIANIMRTPETDFERLGSVLVELGNNFATTEGEILSFGLRIAPVAAALGSSEEAVFGLSAALTSLGIPAERGGTAVQRVLTTISQAVNAGGDDLRNWANAAGVSVDEFVQAFRREPAEAFALFVRGLDDINRSGGSVFGTLNKLEIQEQRTIQVLLAAAGGYEIINDALRTAAIEGGEVNALQEESARRFGTTASQLQILANAFNDLRIEVGGMILGSGGLTAAIDVLREFFSIVRTNIDSLGSMAQGLALIAGIRIALSLGNMVAKAGQAVTALRTLGTVTTVTATATTRLQAAMALSNITLGAAAVGIGILMTAWANAAIKAAELRGRIRALNDALEAGEDVGKAYRDSIVDANILTEERRRALADLGVSERAFIDAILNEEDVMLLLDEATRQEARSLSEMDKSLSGASLGLIQMDEWIGKGGKSLLEFVRLTEEAQGDLQAWRDVRVVDLVQELYDAQFAVGKTREEMEALANTALDQFGLGLSNEQFIRWATGASLAAVQLGQDLDKAAAVAEREGRDLGSFVDALFGRGEEGESALEDWTDRIVEIVGSMQEDLSEKFQEVRTTILGGMPTSQDYEQIATITEGGLNRILAAQDRYLLDVESWVNLANNLQGRVSADTMAWFEGLDSATQGAFGRLFAESPQQFETFLAQLEANFARGEAAVAARWESMLPGQMRAAFANMLSVLSNETAALELTGAQTVDAILNGIQTQMMSMPADVADDYMTFLQGIFGDAETAKAFGFDLGDPLVQGILAALKTLAARAKPVITGQALEIKKVFQSRQGFWVGSPSRMTLEIGHQLGEGLIVGLEESIRDFNPMQLRNQFQPRIESLFQPSVNVMPAQANKNVKVEIHHDGGAPLARDLQLAGIVGSVLAQT